MSTPRMTAGLMVTGSDMAGFTILGLVIDFAAGTMPVFTVSLTLLGFIMVFLYLMQYAKWMRRANLKRTGF